MVFFKWWFYMAVCQNLVPLVNIKIAGKWMFIPLKMVLIGIDPYPYRANRPLKWTCRWCFFVSNSIPMDFLHGFSWDDGGIRWLTQPTAGLFCEGTTRLPWPNGHGFGPSSFLSRCHWGFHHFIIALILMILTTGWVPQLCLLVYKPH